MEPGTGGGSVRSADSLAFKAATPTHPATRHRPLCQNSGADRQRIERTLGSLCGLHMRAQLIMTGAGVMQRVPWGLMLSADPR